MASPTNVDLRQLMRSRWADNHPDTVEQLLASQGIHRQSLSERGSAGRLIELIQTEIELRRTRGDELDGSQYSERFPEVPAEVFDDLILMPAPPPSEDAESLLPSRYRLAESLGSGGVGQVWRAWDHTMQRNVAIKVIHPRFRGNATANRRLEREASLTGGLQHPGVPPIYDFGTLVDGSHFVVMKVIEGSTLADLLRSPDQCPPIASLLGTFEQVSQTVAFAHSQGVVHRDLKPQNVMVGAFGEVQVMDWGMAKTLHAKDDTASFPAATSLNESTESLEADAQETRNRSLDSSIADADRSLTRAGDLCGTPAYMAPEQARGDVQSVNRASDVFCLGAMLFEMLTGKRLYGEGDSHFVLEAAAAGPSEATLSALDHPSVDRPLADLCRECLKPVPGDRLADAAHVAQRLADYLAGVEARMRQAEIDRATSQLQSQEQLKRQRVTTWFAAALAASLALGGAGVMWQWRQTASALKQSDLNLTEARRQTEIAEEQSELSLDTLTDVIRSYQDVFDTSQTERVDTPEAERARRRILTAALEAMKMVSARLKERSDFSANMVIAHVDLGTTYLAIGGEDYADARDLAAEEYKLAHETAKAFSEAFPEDVYAGRLYSQAKEKMGMLAFMNGDSDEAIRWLQEAVDLAHSWWERNPDSKAVAQDLLNQYHLMGGAEFRRFALDAATANYEQALQVIEQAKAREVDIVDDYEARYVVPDIEYRLQLLGHLPAVRRDPQSAFALENSLGPQSLYDCAAWAAFEGKFEEAAGFLEQMGDFETLQPNLHYNRACGYGRCARALLQDRATDQLTEPELVRLNQFQQLAVRSLRDASKAGFFEESSAIALMQRDPDLDAIRDHEDFQAFSDELRGS